MNRSGVMLCRSEYRRLNLSGCGIGQHPAFSLRTVYQLALAQPGGKQDVGCRVGKCQRPRLGVQLFGRNIDVDEHGESITGDTMLLLYNADHGKPIPFKLPPTGEQNPWQLVFDTAREDAAEGEATKETYDLQAVSMVVFCAKTALREDISLVPHVSPPAPG